MTMLAGGGGAAKRKGALRPQFDLPHITHGRITKREEFKDFVSLSAAVISNQYDPVHAETRLAESKRILERYQPAEVRQMEYLFGELAAAITANVEHDAFIDVLGRLYTESNYAGKSQDFTPEGMAKLLARLGTPNLSKLPERGYFLLNEPTCGSGALVLAAAEYIGDAGYNLCQHLVVQASDVDRCCAEMAYIQLSLYGIPAVVVRGDVLTLKEYDRYYTPAYIFGEWVWRQSMPFGSGRSWADELLKFSEEPMYAVIRRMEWGLWKNDPEGPKEKTDE